MVTNLNHSKKASHGQLFPTGIDGTSQLLPVTLRNFQELHNMDVLTDGIISISSAFTLLLKLTWPLKSGGWVEKAYFQGPC